MGNTTSKLASMGVSLLCSFALHAAEPIFYAGFDGSLEPASARGSKTFKTETPVSFQDGIRGKALVIGTDPQGVRHGVAYPHEKNLNWTEGAISFWLKPVNWKGSDTGFFVPVFDAKAGKNYFMIYKYCVGETFYFMRGEHGFWLFTQFKPGEWKPGGMAPCRLQLESSSVVHVYRRALSHGTADSFSAQESGAEKRLPARRIQAQFQISAAGAPESAG